MKKIFGRPKCMTDKPFHYCPGCGHGIVHRLIGEVIDELGIQDRTIGVPPVGCAVIMYHYFNIDMTEAAHGRTPAVATGIKRVHPDKVVFTYQGDGDLAAIGTGEIIHAANRGERITTIFVNNTVYGMTGGQMAPTTLISQKTTTTPLGRDARLIGYPIKISEMLAVTDGSIYIERVAVNKPANIIKAKKAIKKAFQIQLEDVGFSMVEVLSQCPVNLAMTPQKAAEWIDNTLIKTYPLGVIKDKSGE
ncbi:MAG: thiamine pyrophosphate-dependent enzyme [bacterium]